MVLHLILEPSCLRGRIHRVTMNRSSFVCIRILMDKLNLCWCNSILVHGLHLVWCGSSIFQKKRLDSRDSRQLYWLAQVELSTLTHWTATEVHLFAAIEVNRTEHANSDRLKTFWILILWSYDETARFLAPWSVGWRLNHEKWYEALFSYLTPLFAKCRIVNHSWMIFAID